jgi:hypothetical protein
MAELAAVKSVVWVQLTGQVKVIADAEFIAPGIQPRHPAPTMQAMIFFMDKLL